MPRSVRGKVAIASVGETTYHKRGQAKDPEYVRALQAILAACADAGIAPREVDGFASYRDDQNGPARIAAALGLPELHLANMVWGGDSPNPVPGAGAIPMLGNLAGDPLAPVEIGAAVEPLFEDHEGEAPYTLVQWRRV